MSTKAPIKNVVIAVAMQQEAEPFITHLDLTPVDNFFPEEAPFKAFGGVYEECKLTVVTNGQDNVYGTGVENVGTVPAALVTFLTLQKLKGDVDLVINAGTCGGFKAKGAEVGDVFITEASANHDRRIAIPPYIPYGVGKIESTNTDSLRKAIGAKLGIVSTGNSLDKHDWDDEQMKKNDASVKDMEAAAIAWSCALHDVPHFGVKVVTDIVDGDKPSDEEFMENLASAAKSLQEALPKVVAHVCGKKHDEL